jgi:hypothetical protein
MKRTTFRRALCGAAITLALVSGAQATTIRTHVSINGNDANVASDCKRTTPCRTFAAAYTVTQSSGEIVALDSAGFGPITIDRPVTITGPADLSYISVAANTVGITLNAGATDRIVIRNVHINGDGASNTIGVLVNSGLLVLQNSIVKELTTGLKVNSTKADVTNTDFIGNTVAIATTGTGVDTNTFPLTGTTVVRVAHGSVLDNGTAYQMNNPGTACSGNCSKVTIFAFTIGNGFTVNQAGNGNVALGTGASCDPTVPQGCQAIGSYGSFGNQQAP